MSDLKLLPVVTVPMGTVSRSLSEVSGPLTLTVCCDPWGMETRGRGPRLASRSRSTTPIVQPVNTQSQSAFLCSSVIGWLTAALDGLFQKWDCNFLFDYLNFSLYSTLIDWLLSLCCHCTLATVLSVTFTSTCIVNLYTGQSSMSWTRRTDSVIVAERECDLVV